MSSGGDALSVTIGGRDIGLQALLQKIDAEMQTSADSAVRLGQQYARLAQAQGKPALSSQVLAGTISQAGAASEKALIGIETQAARVGAGSAYFEQFGSAAVSQLTAIAGPAAAATVAIQGLKGAFDLSQSSAKIDATRVSFDHLAASVNTTGDALLAKMRAAADGTVADADLIQSANSGLLLTQGRLAQDLPRILEISRAAAQATGDDVNFIFNSLVTGIARGSPKIIDNAKITLDAAAAMDTYAKSIGKTTDQLTAADQQQATLNAVLLAGDQLQKNAGAATDSNAQSFARAGTALTNFKNAFGSQLAQQFAPYAKLLADVSDGWTGLTAALRPATDAQAAATATASAAATAAYNAELARTGDSIAATAAGESARAASLRDSAAAAAAAASAQAPLTAAVIAGGGAFQAYAAAAIDAANGNHIVTAATFDFLAATQAAAQASVESTARQQEQSAVTQLLTAQSKLATDQFLALNPQISLSGAAAAAAANGYSPQIQKLILLAVAARDAQGALAALSGASAGGVTEGRAERDTQADRAQVGSDKALKANADLLAKLNKTAKAAGGVKLSDQAKLQNSLLASQEDYQQKSEDAAAQHAIDVEKINQDFMTKMRAAQQDFDQAQLDGRAGFYDQLGSIESQKIAQAASAAYEAASIEAGKIAQTQGADVAEKYMSAQESIISARAKRLADIEKAEKDKDKGKAEYLKGVDAEYQKAEDAKLARIKEGGGSLEAEKQKQLSDAAAKEADAQDKIGLAADRAAEKKITASERAGKKIDEEAVKVDGLAGKYDRLGAAGTRAGITPTASPVPSGAAPTGAAPNAASAAAADPIADALNGLREAIAAVERATKAAGDQVSGAVSRAANGRLAA